MWCLKTLASHRRSFFSEGSCRPPQVKQFGVWQRARFGRLCGMMKAQEIQFDGVRMYMWCLKILASHRRSFFFEGSCRPPQVKQVGVSQRARLGLLCFEIKVVVWRVVSRSAIGSLKSPIGAVCFSLKHRIVDLRLDSWCL